MSGFRIPTALVCALALVNTPLGCKKDEAGERKAEAEASAEADKDDAVQADEPPPSADTPPGQAAAAGASWWDDSVPQYQEDLQDLLDLVPAGAKVAVVVRDVDGVLAVVDAVVRPVQSAGDTIVRVTGDPNANVELKRAAEIVGKLRQSLGSEGKDLQRGVVLAEADGKNYLVHAGTDPEALPKLLQDAASKDDLDVSCKQAPEAEGWVVCETEGGDPGAYKPGKDGATIRDTLIKSLGQDTLERANVLSWHPDAEIVASATATPPGGIHLALAPKSEQLAKLAQTISPGPAPALQARPPRGGFYWQRVDPKDFEAQINQAPPIAQTSLRTATGEAYLGSLEGMNGVVLLVGVTDPAPVAGLLSLASAAFENVPKQLPDGTKLSLALEPLEVGGTTTQAVHATFEPAPAIAKGLAEAGLEPEAWAFAAGSYAAVVVGAGSDAVKKITELKPDAEPKNLGSLPPPLQRGLSDGTLGLAAYLSIDGLQNPKMLASLGEQLAAAMPPDAPGPSAKDTVEVMRASLAPLSDLSMWAGEEKTMHIGISLFADPRTEEGKEALATLEAINEGKDAQAQYDALTGKYGSSSPRTSSYLLRSGEPQIETVFILGVAAAIAIPAFTKYVERSKQAAGL